MDDDDTNIPRRQTIGDTETCDQMKLLLKKNRSWTHISSSNNNTNNNNNAYSLAQANCLRISRSNPHVLESLPSNLKFKLPSLQQISSRFHSQILPSQSGKPKKLAPLAKAISFTSTATIGTNQAQTLSTPTAIRFNHMQRYNRLMFLYKVNNLFRKLKSLKVQNESQILFYSFFVKLKFSLRASSLYIIIFQ